MILFKLFILFILSISLNSKEMYFDTISLSKIKKLVKKEEKIAKAYKQYIMNNATKPTSILGSEITSLKTYLPDGFTTSNLFGKFIYLDTTDNHLTNDLPSNVKSLLYDEYYSNKNRIYTKAPNSKKNKKIKIVLLKKENYILTQTVTMNKDTTKNKEYYLDDDGV